MGCICSKGSSEEEAVEQNKEEDFSMASVQLVAPASSKRDSFILEVSGVTDGSSKASYGSVHKKTNDEQDSKTIIVERPVSSNHQRRTSLESRKRPEVSRMLSMRRGPQGEEAIPGWPSWLTSVATDAIKGWIPRRAESFEKFDKIGQGTYSTVYKARDLETGKIVALKKVRFTNMDPESVRFMAREIYILRRLDHPNIMKLEGIVTSRISCSLYLVFEYMEHDLSGLIARGIKFTESQVKCYMQQLLRGLEHCHSRSVLHRDIKGSNLLIDSNGVLKIGDFGLANVYEQNQPLTSRVVTLWYRAPELLLGATEYGPAIDLWSAGCILAELLAAKPIMPGRTEVEQMHKIFKLCGSPAEDYWQKTKLPHATSFKPQHPYKRRLSETYKDFPPSAMSLLDILLAIEPEKRGSASSALQSELFTTDPLPCDPSSLPKYPPSKELDAKIRDEEARRTRADNMKGQGAESLRRGPNVKVVPHEVRNISVQAQPKTASHKYIPQEDCGSGFLIDPPRGARQNGYSQSRSVMHPSAVGSSWNKTVGSTRDKPELSKQTSQRLQPTTDLKKDDIASRKESGMGYVPKKKRIHYSGPLMPPGGNMEDMLKEHERQIQQAVRKARLDKNRNQ